MRPSSVPPHRMLSIFERMSHPLSRPILKKQTLPYTIVLPSERSCSENSLKKTPLCRGTTM